MTKEEKILDILERNSEWLRGSAVPFGMVEDNRAEIVKEITQLMCDREAEVFFMFCPLYTLEKQLEKRGFSLEQISDSIEKLNEK